MGVAPSTVGEDKAVAVRSFRSVEEPADVGVDCGVGELTDGRSGQEIILTVGGYKGDVSPS